jgi:hypothetical protein
LCRGRISVSEELSCIGWYFWPAIVFHERTVESRSNFQKVKRKIVTVSFSSKKYILSENPCGMDNSSDLQFSRPSIFESQNDTRKEANANISSTKSGVSRAESSHQSEVGRIVYIMHDADARRMWWRVSPA